MSGGIERKPGSAGPAAKALIGVPWGRVHVLLPGLTAAALIAWAGYRLSDLIGVRLLGFTHSPLSPVMVSLLLGIILGNAVPIPSFLKPGMDFAMKKLLRLGIILLGIGLSIFEVFRLGLFGVPIVVGCIAGALLLTVTLNRLLHLPPRLGTLVAVGTSICGVSAIVSAAPVIGAEDEEVTYAVAVITVFGLLATVAYPYLADRIFAGDPVRAGLFLGTAVHDTSQVTGSALVYSDIFSRPRALEVATITKLVRNVFMVLVIPLLAWVYGRSRSAAGAAGPKAAGIAAPRLGRLFPTFILGFLALAVLRSIGDWTALRGGRVLGLLAPESWVALIGALKTGSVLCIVAALAGVGLGTRLSILHGLGWKPFLVGLGAALGVGGISFLLIGLFAPLLRL